MLMQRRRVGKVSNGYRCRRNVAWAAPMCLVMLGLVVCAPGCGSAPVSTNYFALVPGNSWLYEGSVTGSDVRVEVNVLEPDASLNLPAGTVDLSIAGSLGSFKISQQGLFLQVTANEVKLHGFTLDGGSPQFYASPYIWLKKPIKVGQQYNTALRGAPIPSVTVVTGETEEPTPWGPRKGFVLQQQSGTGPAGGVDLVFVPNLGFMRIALPDLPELVVKDASLE